MKCLKGVVQFHMIQIGQKRTQNATKTHFRLHDVFYTELDSDKVTEREDSNLTYDNGQ